MPPPPSVEIELTDQKNCLAPTPLVFTAPDKVIHPKYYKHLKKGAHQSHLGRQKMSWFLADQPVH